ncbi:diaminopimelate decarboxylase [Oceanotoga sp. DSM 15011]|uniref:diaminopimelate decarboxylase n=1 Tax=unclassified Oceanotoga TaxID=2618448 RepID=UPI0021F3E32F|nr:MULTISPECIES: diaminopimelate decarboxylase [unclassified Oceanotoga]MDN5342036.1 diaminopimelate decarboxylase [Oceanotoga sp.]UYO99001.1 diaminopimelate decarboxylase [Oceanotoga sp. DSM 15011]
MKIDENKLYINGVSAEEIRKNHGTPVIVYDYDEIIKNISEYRDNFKKNYENFSITYASKAFLNRTLCNILKKENLDIDIVSSGELAIALSANFPVEKIYFHGNNKTEEEINYAIKNNIGTFIIDNLQEAQKIDKIAKKYDKKIKAIMRLIPGIEAHTHEYIKTGHIDSKFGFNLYKNHAYYEIEKIQNNLKNIDIKGIGAHIGSQIFDIKPYEDLLEVLFEFSEKLKNINIDINIFDIGGGLGVIYTDEDTYISKKEFVEKVSKKTKTLAKKYNKKNPHLIIEPGRSIIATAGTTLYTVGNIKENSELTNYIAVDGGMADNIRPSLYQAKYTAYIANKMKNKKEKIYTIAGKYCESGDILIKNIKLPIAEIGDIIAIPVTGAYSYSMASNYNGALKPEVIIIKNKKSYIMNKRETVEDLLKNDINIKDL